MLLVVFLTAPAFGLSVRDNAFNGVWQDWGNGWKYCYFSSGDTAWWKDGDAVRLGYQYGQGQWWDYGLGGWNAISAKNTASTFIGDGKWYDLKSGWSFCYNAVNDTAAWGDNNVMRLRYGYASGQWWDYGIGGWNKIGADRVSSKFIGDGGSYDLKNGWSYYYNPGTDTAWWKDGGAFRFAHEYVKGQWYDYGFGGWNKIGAEQVSSKFIGDTAWYDLKNGWSFAYTASNDTAAWGDNNLLRFRYSYGPGQWWDYGIGGWNKIGADRVSSKFIGTAGWYDLKNGWSFCYNPANDTAAWGDNNQLRFRYSYGSGQWEDYGLGGWNKIGAEKVTSKFIGDTGWYDLKNGWSFSYNPVTDTGFWGDNNVLRLGYNYSSGQWSHRGMDGWHAIGNEKVSSVFVGDGTYHDLKDGWAYFYNASNDTAYWWFVDGSYPYVSYDFVVGQWYADGFRIGSQGASARFIGDGQDFYDAKTGASFVLNLSEKCVQLRYQGRLRFEYSYSSDMYYHYGHDKTVLTGPVPFLLWIAGDGDFHELNSNWKYRYDYQNDTGFWMETGGQVRFAYAYSEGQWSHFNGTRATLGTIGNSSAFLGDGMPHSLGDGWTYQHSFPWEGSRFFSDYYNVAPGELGVWTNGYAKFIYSYTNSSWFYATADMFRDERYLGSVAWPDFVGDGRWHDLGNQWAYRFENNLGYWAASGNELFAYDYENRQWHASDYQKNWMSLTLAVGTSPYNTSFSCSFVGDGEWHYVGDDNLYFRYISSEGAAQWKAGDSEFLKYTYGTDEWKVPASGIWSTLSIQQTDFSLVPAIKSYLANPTQPGEEELVWEDLLDGAITFPNDPGVPDLRTRLTNLYNLYRKKGVTSEHYRFIYEDGLGEIAEGLRDEIAEAAYDTAKYLIGPHSEKDMCRIRVFLLDQEYQYSNGTTMMIRDDWPNTGGISYDYDGTSSRKEGYIVLFVKPGAQEEEGRLERYGSTLAHETTHALMRREIGGVEKYTSENGPEGNTQFSYFDINNQQWNFVNASRLHWGWFTESLARYAGHVKYWQELGETDPSTDFCKSILDLGNSLDRLFTTSDSRTRVSWTDMEAQYLGARVATTEEFEFAKGSFTAIGWFFGQSNSVERTRDVLDLVRGGDGVHPRQISIDDAFASSSAYNKRTGQDAWQVNANPLTLLDDNPDTLYEDYYNRFVSWNP